MRHVHRNPVVGGRDRGSMASRRRRRAPQRAEDATSALVERNRASRAHWWRPSPREGGRPPQATGRHHETHGLDRLGPDRQRLDRLALGMQHRQPGPDHQQVADDSPARTAPVSASATRDGHVSRRPRRRRPRDARMNPTPGPAPSSKCAGTSAGVDACADRAGEDHDVDPQLGEVMRRSRSRACRGCATCTRSRRCLP